MLAPIRTRIAITPVRAEVSTTVPPHRVRAPGDRWDQGNLIGGTDRIGDRSLLAVPPDRRRTETRLESRPEARRGRVDDLANGRALHFHLRNAG